MDISFNLSWCTSVSHCAEHANHIQTERISLGERREKGEGTGERERENAETEEI